MIPWLDHMLFGNGHGLRSPYFDERFYWLSGQLYTWFPGLGAQLQSFEWRHPKPGEIRTLGGRQYRPFNSTRKGPRVRVMWALTRLPEDTQRALFVLRQIEHDLGRPFASAIEAATAAETAKTGSGRSLSGAVPPEEAGDAQNPTESTS